MIKICFAILAHGSRDVLLNQIGNLRTFAPTADIVLYNGGQNTSWCEQIGVPICPASAPLKWQKVAPFHLGIFRWIGEMGLSYDWVVTLDWDMMLVKPGFTAWLDVFGADYDYIATRLFTIKPNTDWPVAERFMYKWRRIWQPLFGIEQPLGCFNPGQMFSRTYIDQLLNFPALPEIKQRIERSHTPSLEEVVWPTMAAATGCRWTANPGSYAIQNLRLFGSQEYLAFINDPCAFLVHKVSTDLGAPDRVFINDLEAWWLSHSGSDFIEVNNDITTSFPPVDLSQHRPRYRDFLSKGKSLLLRILPE